MIRLSEPKKYIKIFIPMFDGVFVSDFLNELVLCRTMGQKSGIGSNKKFHKIPKMISFLGEITGYIVIVKLI